MSADPISRSFIRLAFHIERLAPGFIDAYFGPAEWKAQAEAEGDIPPARLRAEAQTLLHETGAVADPIRREWLTKQVTAMIAVLRRAEGETLPFEDEVRLIYDIQPPWTDNQVYLDSLRQLDDLLPGPDPLAERLDAWDSQFNVPAGKLLDTAAMCRDEARRRTLKLFSLPEGEEIVLEIVSNQPWGAYNWYLGNYRSRVEVNTDLPVRANSLPGLMTHEGYPGHHTEHALKEKLLYRDQGHAEACIQLINAPECVISEGIADLGWEIIFTENEMAEWQAQVIYSATGVQVDPARALAINRARRSFRSLSANAAYMLHRDGAPPEQVVNYLKEYGARTDKQAQQNLRFLSNPLFRSYIFTYHYGRDLLKRFVEAGDQLARFRLLLEQPITPALVEQWIAAPPPGV